jgi:small GTP-binding protein
MTTNPSPEYGHALKRYNSASTNEEKIAAMEEMLRTMPQHKSAESLRANLRTRYKKLLESVEKQKKSGKGGKAGIRKENLQACIVGFPNVGKTSLFNVLTGQGSPSPVPFSTREPDVGALMYDGCNIQIVDMAPFPNEDKSTLNIADTVILLIDNLAQIKEAQNYLSKTLGKKIVVYNKIDSLSDEEKRKLVAQLQTKKIPAILISCITLEGILELKKRLLESFPIIRVYLKEPKKPASDKALIMDPGATVKDVAEKILKGFSKKVRKVRVTGPSAKFPEQVVGLEHAIQDKDTVEFQTS